MVKRLNIAFDDRSHEEMKIKKDILKTDLKLVKLSWEDYFLILSGVKKKHNFVKNEIKG
jgi:hypothetical protein